MKFLKNLIIVILSLIAFGIFMCGLLFGMIF